MKTKITKTLILTLLIITIFLTGCLDQNTQCNYDGICEDWETDDCPDCADVLGRGIPDPGLKVNTENNNY